MINKMIAPIEIGICCIDLDKMRKFYEQALGCTFVSEIRVGPEKARQSSLSTHAYTVIRLQTSYGERIKLLKADNNKQDIGTISNDFLLENRGIGYLTFIVSDIDKAILLLADNGARFLTGNEKVAVRDGVFLAFCRDPEGNVIELVQYQDIAAYRKDIA